MAAKILVLCATFLFATTNSQRCSSITPNPFTSQTSKLQPSLQNNCGLQTPLNLDSSISQNGGITLLQGSNIGCQSSSGIPCSSNNGASCSCNDNGIFIPCETPIVLNIDIPSGITVSSLGEAVKVSPQSGLISETCGSGNVNNALNSAALNLGSYNAPCSSSFAQNNALNSPTLSLFSNNGACANPNQISQFPIASGSKCGSVSNLNLLNIESNCLSRNSNLKPNSLNLQGDLQSSVCQSNSNLGSNNFVQNLQPQVCNSAISNTPLKTLPNSQTITIAQTNVIDKACSPPESLRSQTSFPISSITQNFASNFNPNFISNQPIISSQINSLPSVSSPKITSCIKNVQPPSIPTPKSISCPNLNIPSVNFNPLPSNPFSSPCDSVPSVNVIKSTITPPDTFNAPSLNALPFSSSNKFNAPCNIGNTNINTPSFISADLISQSPKVAPCINTPSINLGTISLSSNSLNSPCTVPSNSITDALITQSASPIAQPFPNVQTVNSDIEPYNSLALSSINSNRQNIQTIQAIPCECTKLSSFGSLNPISCENCRLPSSLSSNQISALNLPSFDNNCNLNLIQTKPIITNCKSSSNTVTLPIFSNNIPSVGCQVASSPTVLPQVITSTPVDLQSLNLLSPTSQCNPISVTPYTNQPTVLPSINPPTLSSATSTPVIATTIIDNTVSNSLANALQLLIVSNLIQSLNNPSTLPANNVGFPESVATSTSVYSQASDSITTGQDLSSINVASAASASTVDAYLPNQVQDGYADANSYNQFNNGYQEPYYPSFYDILAQSLFENYPPTGPLAPIASRILGLPNPNIPYDNNYYNGPYDNNFDQNPQFYPDPNFYGSPEIFSEPFNRGPEIYPEPNFYGLPDYYPETNNFYGPEPSYPYPNNMYNIPEFYPDTNNFYGVPEVYPDSSNFYNTPENYGDVSLDNFYGTPESYVDNAALPYTVNDISANAYAAATVDDSTNFYAAPDLSASAIAYLENDLNSINSLLNTYTPQRIENPVDEVTVYLLPESNILTSNPTYTIEPISLPTYNYIDNCPSSSIQLPAEVYLPSNLYPSNSFAPSPFYINQREIANPLSAVTPIAAEILIPSEFPANLICDLCYVPNDLPAVNVGKPLFEIEADFSKLFGNGCYC